MGKRRGNQISLTRATTPRKIETEPEQEEQPSSVDEVVEQPKESSGANPTVIAEPAVTPLQTAVSPPVSKAEPEMIRTTMFFSAEMLDRLDTAKMNLSKLTGIRGRAVSRTRIVEMALELMLADLEARQVDSALVATLLDKQ